ncbi:MAG: hypothetical protein GSR80_001800 [Desulfurococcales archaeon]|nr:hypothetical protein [Desulfurococcales archaeon]
MASVDAALITVNLAVDEPIEYSAFVEKVIRAADKVRREYGIAVRVEVPSTTYFDPLRGWVHNLAVDEASGGRGAPHFSIIRDGAAVEVTISDECRDDELERALLEAALAIMSPKTASDDASHVYSSYNRDPGSFASGEYLIEIAVEGSAAM